jgi:hypothetical protein
LPICATGQTADAGNCADLSNYTNSLINLHNNSYDLIQSCNGINASQASCVNLPSNICGSLKCNSNLKFRVNYSMQTNDKRITPLNTIACNQNNLTSCSENSNYFYTTSLAQCPKITTNTLPCIFISGINVGNYKDISLKFPTLETSNNLDDLVSTDTIQDIRNNIYNIEARIARVYNEDANPAQQTKQICAYNITNGTAFQNTYGSFSNMVANQSFVLSSDLNGNNWTFYNNYYINL